MWLVVILVLVLASIPITVGQSDGILGNIRGRHRWRHNNQGTDAPEDNIETRIIGGSEVNPSDNRYPYFVSMRGTGVCGGVLITPSIAISAAHCAPASDSVVVGMESLDQSLENQYSAIDIEEKVVHPLYGNAEVGYSYDIMVMKLAQSSSQPYIMLNLNASVPVADQVLWVLGFGDIAASEKEQILPYVLNEVDVQYITPDVCTKDYAQNLIHDDMICAASNGKDACAGDSGGPLIIKGNSAAEDVLAGTVAWGIGCADSRYPGVYSRTSFFVSWIVEQVCLLSPDDAPAYMACNSAAGFRAETTAVPSDANVLTTTPAPSNPLTTIKFVGWNPQNRGVALELCQGDCDHNNDCAGDMICARVLADRTRNQCQMNPNDNRKKNFDVCINP